MDNKSLKAKKLISGFSLGEGPVFMDELSTLFWVDIKGNALHSLQVETKKTSYYPFSDAIAAVMPYSKEIIICLIGDSLCYVNVASGKIEKKVTLISDPTMRFNDAKCDQYGNMWAGTMKRVKGADLAGSGFLYCIKNDKIVNEYTGFSIPNGLDWVNGHFYHIETEEHTIYQYTIENEINLTHKEKFLTIEKRPDGMTKDAEGNLYVALWGSGEVIKIAAGTKKITSLLTTDTIHSSCLCFGGKDFKTIFITSAEDADGLKNGALYSIPSEVKGVAPYSYKSSFTR